MFTVGSKVVCVNNNGVEEFLTVGKTYTIIKKINGDYFYILDGDNRYYLTHRFISLKEYRKIKLEVINGK